jgi:hypothetical protein
VTYVTLSSVRAAASARGITKSLAVREFRTKASAPLTTQYDVFLSHSSEDADVIAGVKTLLEKEGTSVYVYWADDDQAQRVTPATAARLRARMQNCRSLIYASSGASANSKWMPWELGYFDGRKPRRVAIFPLVSSSGSSFPGQEYLGLYPYVEDIRWKGGRRGLGIYTARTSASPIKRFVDEGVDPTAG